MEDEGNELTGYLVQGKEINYLTPSDNVDIKDGCLNIIRNNKIVACFQKDEWTSYFYAKDEEEYYIYKEKFFPSKKPTELSPKWWRFWR